MSYNFRNLKTSTPSSCPVTDDGLEDKTGLTKKLTESAHHLPFSLNIYESKIMKVRLIEQFYF